MTTPPPSIQPVSSILVVDDEPDLRTLYELTLLREGHNVRTAASLADAREALAAETFSVVITDMRLPDGLGLALLHELRSAQRSERCVVMTAYGSAENAVEALKTGAFDYLTKPVDLAQFRQVVASALRSSRWSGEAGATPSSPSTHGDRASSGASSSAAQSALALIVGESAAIRAVKSMIERAARSMAPVIVRGESGTGKELVARALHACSHRAAGPWIAVNCSAIPETLLEAEFFGARRGSFTGATQDRSGFFQAANGGTLFLDEVAELPLAMQSKLLRAIQERRIRPLGATQEEAVDVRIVSASHRDLAQEVQEGRFRQDLFYRLQVIEIAVPALRERREDIPLLVGALANRIAAESGTPAVAPSPELIERLSQGDYPGNVRELENALHRALALGDAAIPAAARPVATQAGVSSAALGPPTDAIDDLPNDLQAHLDTLERSILQRALQAHAYNRTAAAARLGISLRQMRYRIERLQIPMPGGIDADDA